jgi:hypothetical protein
MAIIYTYPKAIPVSGDLLIFSDISTEDPANATRTCTVGNLVALVGDLVPGGGTVQEVTVDIPDAMGLRTSGETEQTITTTGTFTLGGQMNAGYGGTGLTAFAKGDIIYGQDPDEITISMAKLSIGDTGDVLKVGGSGLPVWDATAGCCVDSVTAIAPATQTGTNPIVVTPTTGLVTVQSLAYDGGTKAGHVPGTSGGVSTVYLNGAGSFSTPPDTNTTYSLMTDTVLGLGKLEDNTTQLTAASIVSSVASRTYGIQKNSSDQLVVNVPWTDSNGIYGGSGSLSGATIVTTGANDLTFTATTGDVIFNNNVSPNPVFFINGASNNIGIGTSTPSHTLQVEANTDEEGLRINGSQNQYTGTFYSDTTTDEAWGVYIRGGTSSSDSPFIINKADGSSTYLRVNGNGKVGIGTASPSANADLTLEGGALAIKETTTPTADADYGKIYCKADNKLYFQDGAGVEHEIQFV